MVTGNSNAPGFHFFDGGILVDRLNTVIGNSVSHNSRGIVAGENDITGNRVFRNGQGIAIEAEDEANRVERNQVISNEGNGISAGDNTVIARNIISDNGGHGIDHGDTKLNRIEMNIVSRNGGDGIHGLGFDQMIVRHNLVIANRGAGMVVEDGAGKNRIEGNRIWDNGGPASSWARVPTGTTWQGNSVLRNARSHGPVDDWTGGIRYFRAIGA